MTDTRSPIERMIDEACGYTPQEHAPKPYREVLCCCGERYGSRRECQEERGIKTPCRCYCHSEEAKTLRDDELKRLEAAND
ncbi:MAG: hypothetical protein VW405_01920 [Rhodospirillaceae bacterium]